MAREKNKRGSFRAVGERLSYTSLICVSVYMDDEPQWKERAIAIEFWLLAALTLGSLLYGLYCGLRSLVG